MRVLILVTAFLAYATAAPSGALLTPLSPILLPAVAVAPNPAIPAGDIQAALIDAKVQAEDRAQAAIDQVRELAEKAVDDQNEKIIEANGVIKEKSEEAFWAGQEKTWQALDAVKTAEAQIDGSIASNADVIAKSLVTGISPPIVAPIGAIAPIVSPIASPIVYAAPGIVAPDTKTIVAQSLTQIHPDSVSVQAAGGDSVAAVVKTAEINENKAESAAIQSAVSSAESASASATESAQAAAAAYVKSAETAQALAAGSTSGESAQPAAVANPAQSTQLGSVDGKASDLLKAVAAANVRAVELAQAVSAANCVESAIVKNAELAQLSDKAVLASTLTQASPVAIAAIPTIKGSDPWLTPVAYVQPGLNIASVQQVQGQVLTPILKTQW